MFNLLDQEAEPGDVQLEQIAAEHDAAVQKVHELKKWLGSLPLSKRPLVKVSCRLYKVDHHVLFLPRIMVAPQSHSCMQLTCSHVPLLSSYLANGMLLAGKHDRVFRAWTTRLPQCC